MVRATICSFRDRGTFAQRNIANTNDSHYSAGMRDKVHPDPNAKPFVPTPVPAGAVAPNLLARRRFVSAQLFGDTTEVEIEHGESLYRLRLTSLGKLILTK